jgi:tripartite-type tricarboxylate transporter receptor subunit TctC
LFAPARTPKPVIGKVEQATKVAMQDPELKKNFEAGGFETLDTIDSAAAVDYVAKEVTRWKPILAQFRPQ